MTKHRIVLIVTFILFVATMNMRQVDAQGGTNPTPVPTVPTLLPPAYSVFLSHIEQAHKRLSPVEAALTAEDVGPSFVRTGGGGERGDYYEYAFVIIENGPINVTEDVYVMDTLANAIQDYADTEACYRNGDDGCTGLTELAAASIGDESAFFKGQGLQYLLIIRRANVVIVLGTQNMSSLDTLALGQKAADKL